MVTKNNTKTNNQKKLKYYCQYRLMKRIMRIFQKMAILKLLQKMKLSRTVIMPIIIMIRSLIMTNYNQMRMPSYEYPQAYLLPALNSYECINPESVLPYKQEILNIKEELRYA